MLGRIIEEHHYITQVTSTSGLRVLLRNELASCDYFRHLPLLTILCQSTQNTALDSTGTWPPPEEGKR